MGTRNKERRAAHKRKRAAATRMHGAARARVGLEDELGALLEETLRATLCGAAAAQAHGEEGASVLCAQLLLAEGGAEQALRVARVASDTLAATVTSLHHHGWQPRDLLEVARRRAPGLPARLLQVALAVVAERHPQATTHPEWLRQLRDGGALRWWSEGTAPLQAVAESAGEGLAPVVAAAVDLLATIGDLPVLPRLLPLPGAAGAARPQQVLDDEALRALARVRALVVKAEATDFPEEAEALTAKAQQLMARHHLAARLVEARDPAADPAPGAVRLWLDAPYVDPKAMLVSAVARANRCQAVQQGSHDFVTVVGHQRDLAATELLVTSLLVQATRAMVQQPGVVVGRRTTSFRRSFLVAFAQRTGERLAGVTDAAVHESDSASLLPVLASDEARVKAERARLFPALQERMMSVTNSAGWLAGRVAAEQAVLPVSPALAS